MLHFISFQFVKNVKLLSDLCEIDVAKRQSFRNSLYLHIVLRVPGTHLICFGLAAASI